MKNKVARWMAVAALVAGPGAAWAVPVEWTFGPEVISGTTLSGSFTYDADTDTYTNINISRSGGNLAAATFTVRQQPGVGWQSLAVFFPAPFDPATTASLDGLPMFAIFGTPFSNAGGSVTITVRTDTCLGFSCMATTAHLSGSVRFSSKVPDTSGALASIPTLSEWGLIGLSSLIGLAAVMHTRRHRSLSRLPSRRV
ncbi:MAG: IPTL-CTERM sorting domain-containing protein [Comamonadaceae bacterium]|nr:MAG: IPTL-CTERM sorting domain-containing protein [Comamonadaceae bacterium]